MKKFTDKELIKQGYEIKNAQIVGADLSMADHGCLTFNLELRGAAWAVNYGGYNFGYGYLGAEDKDFEGFAEGAKAIMMIMNTVGVEKFSDLKGKYVRVAIKSGAVVKIIGNIVKNRWFDYGSFFEEESDVDD